MASGAYLSAHILEVKAEVQACRSEIARLHRRCHDLENQVAQGSSWLQTVQDSLTALQTRTTHLHYLVQSVFRVLRRAFSSLSQEVAIYA